MRVLVTGGRDRTDIDSVFVVLDQMHAAHRVTLLVCGLDPEKPVGTDRLAYQWAKSRGIDTVLFPPNWRGRGKAGGPYRNGLMGRFLIITAGTPQVVAFTRANGDWGDGTLDMIRQAEAAGIPVRRIAPSELPAPPSTTAQQEA